MRASSTKPSPPVGIELPRTDDEQAQSVLRDLLLPSQVVDAALLTAPDAAHRVPWVEERHDLVVLTLPVLDHEAVALVERINWDAAERGILTGLGIHGIVDVFRHLHGYQIDEASWLLHRLGTIVKRRFDHVFASEALTPKRCQYLHHVREEGLSDHSALEAEFDWPRRAA